MHAIGVSSINSVPSVVIMIQIGLNLIMELNTTFKNTSVISWRSVLLVEETGVHGENHRPAAIY